MMPNGLVGRHDVKASILASIRKFYESQHGIEFLAMRLISLEVERGRERAFEKWDAQPFLAIQSTSTEVGWLYERG